MTTLSQIRKNKVETSNFKQELNNSYNNPSSLSIVSKLIKKENINIINKISKENGLNNYEKQSLIDKYIKPNFYTPYVVNSETKEKLQQLI
jgi:hypothetical protein